MLDWACRHWPIATLAISLIGGYRVEKVRADYPHFTFGIIPTGVQYHGLLMR
jgi:hypothetical protein